MEKLTDFQKNCERELRKQLGSLRVELKNREVHGAEDPAIRAEMDNLFIWIYADGAEIGGEGLNWRYERYDYDTLDQLCQAFVSKVSSLLHE
jgi:hypothetical protein